MSGRNLVLIAVYDGGMEEGWVQSYPWLHVQQPQIIGQYNELTILINCFSKSLILTTY